MKLPYAHLNLSYQQINKILVSGLEVNVCEDCLLEHSEPKRKLNNIANKGNCYVCEEFKDVFLVKEDLANLT